MTEPATRFDIGLPVELGDLNSEASFRGVSLNLSESGMLVRTDEERPRGTTLRFEFAPFGGTATVIWSETSESKKGREILLGVKFVSMKRQDRKTLIRILHASPSLSSA